MNATLDKLENVFLRDNKFLTGDEITVADIMAVSEVSSADDKILVYGGGGGVKRGTCPTPDKRFWPH